MRKTPWGPPGLRKRVSLMFGLVALLISVLVAVTTYAVARHYLWGQRQDVALRQAFSNARTVELALGSGQPQVNRLLVQIDASAGQAASPLLEWKSHWYDRRFPPGFESLPTALVSMAEDGDAGMQRVHTRAGPVLAVAIPVEQGVYVEVFSLRELEATLSTLALIFAFTTTLATFVGVLIGQWASRRALHPLTSVTAAALSIARGDLGTRLPRQADPDLGPIADAFNSTATELEDRVQRDARFAGNVSHELRTPVTAMVNAVDILGGKADLLDAEGREVLGFLTGDVHRFAQMVRDLLETSRIDAGAVEMRKEEVPLWSYVREVADRRAGRPVTVGEAENPHVMIDPRLMEGVVENLLDNAERYGNGVVRVSVEQGDGVARIMVDDAGPGVPPESRERIFERFARISPPPSEGGDVGGVGLGLALVAENVRLHGGRVWVADSPEGGARFVVQLPLVVQ